MRRPTQARRTLLAPVLLALILSISASVADAAASPSTDREPSAGLTIIVPFKAGSSPDAIVDGLLENWPGDSRPNKTNMTGRSGQRGMSAAASARPDGLTLGLGSGELTTIDPFLTLTGFLGPDDLTPIAAIASDPLVLAVPANSPFRDIESLVRSARRAPESTEFATPGAISESHLAAEQLADVAKADFEYRHLQGNQAVLTSLQDQKADAAIISFSVAAKALRAGRIRALATLGPQPLPQLPGVPSLQQTSMALSIESYLFLFAPRGLDRTVADRIRSSVLEAARSPGYTRALERLDLSAIAWPAAELGDRLSTDFDRVRRQLNGLKVLRARGDDVSLAVGASPGVTVRQLTTLPGAHTLSYYDITAWSGLTGKLYANVSRADPPNRADRGQSASTDARTPVVESSPMRSDTSSAARGRRPPLDEQLPQRWDIVALDPRTGEQRLIVSRRPPSASVTRFDMSQDGRLISYLRLNDPPESGFDLYGYRVDEPGEFRITHSRHPTAASMLKTSPASWDSKHDRYLLAYSIDEKLYLVYDDGSQPENARGGPITLQDPDSTIPFHRIRLNPRYPHLLLYRRDGEMVRGNIVDSPATGMYVVDLRAKEPRGVLWFRVDRGGPHPGWAPDGRKVAVAWDWSEYTLVDSQGELLDGLSPGTTPRRQIGPFGKGARSHPEGFYGSYAPDGRTAVIATRASKTDGGQLFLLDLETEQVRRLCRTDYFGRYIDGQPRVVFLGDTGLLAFSSDFSRSQPRPAPPQIYVVDPGTGSISPSDSSNGQR